MNKDSNDGPKAATQSAVPVTGSRSWGVRIVAIAIILLGIAGASYWWRQSSQAAPQQETAQQHEGGAGAPPPPEVTFANPVFQEIVEWDEYPGQFEAAEYVQIRAQVSGYLQSIHFKDGQMVKQGDLLYVIDKRPFQIDLESALAQREEAQAQLRLANRQMERWEKLLQGDVVPETDYDDRVEAVSSARAAVAAAEAAVHSAELNLDYTEIRAPISGRIGRHLVDIGNLVIGGSSSETTMMATIVSLDPIHFTFDVSEANFLAYQRAADKGTLQSMRDTQIDVTAKLEDEDDWTHKGKIYFINNEVDQTSGTIRLRATLDNPGYMITPGQFGRVRVPGSEPYKAILVPESAVMTDQSQKIVMTIEPDNTVGVRIIRLGPHYGNLRIVREGLKPDDRVIINGLMRVRPGMPVTPKPGQIEPAT